MAHEQDFQTVAKWKWESTKHRPYHQRTKQFCSCSNSWSKCKKQFHNSSEIEQRLLQLQSQSLTSCQHADGEHEILLDKITEYYKQRAKKLWAVDGDDDTEFFQQTVIEKKRKNRIVHVQDLQGNIISTPGEIADVFITYFKNLLSTSNPACSSNAE